jgi:hypothetical protein
VLEELAVKVQLTTWNGLFKPPTLPSCHSDPAIRGRTSQ